MDGTNYHLVRRHVDVRGPTDAKGSAGVRVSVSFCPDKRERSRVSLPREEALALGTWLIEAAEASGEEAATVTFMVKMQQQVERGIG